MDKHIDILHRHIIKNGIAGLLPQNLTIELLELLDIEFNSEKISNGRSSTNLFPTCVALLCNQKIDISSDHRELKIEIKPSQYQSQIEMYSISLDLENLRRAKAITINENELPTLENIFDEKRNLNLNLNPNYLSGVKLEPK